METKELFAQIISKRAWHKKLSISPSQAYIYKTRFHDDNLGEAAMSNILVKLGYEKKITWVKKKE